WGRPASRAALKVIAVVSGSSRLPIRIKFKEYYKCRPERRLEHLPPPMIVVGRSSDPAGCSIAVSKVGQIGPLLTMVRHPPPRFDPVGRSGLRRAWRFPQAPVLTVIQRSVGLLGASDAPCLPPSRGPCIPLRSTATRRVCASRAECIGSGKPAAISWRRNHLLNSRSES